MQCPYLPANWHVYCLGYCISLIIGSYFTKKIVDTMWKELGLLLSKNPNLPYQPPRGGLRIGIIENVLYTSSWVVSKPEFIAVWLAFKIAAQWGQGDNKV